MCIINRKMVPIKWCERLAITGEGSSQRVWRGVKSVSSSEVTDWADTAARHKWAEEFFWTHQSNEWMELKFLLRAWSFPLGVKICNSSWNKIPSSGTCSNGITLRPWRTHATCSWSSTQLANNIPLLILYNAEKNLAIFMVQLDNLCTHGEVLSLESCS